MAPQKDFKWDLGEEEEPKKKLSAKDTIGTATRTTAGVLPLALRLGSGFAAGPLSAVPGLGTLFAAGIGGAGEVLAEMLEKGTLNPLDVDWDRVALEAGISALPLGATLSKGRILKSALKGGALAAGGVAGRKATGEEAIPWSEAVDVRKWSPMDFGQVGIGAGIGGLIGNFTGGKAPVKNDIPEGPLTIEDFLRKGEWSKEKVAAEINRLGAIPGEENSAAVRAYRQAAAKTDTGTPAIYKAEERAILRDATAAEKLRLKMEADAATKGSVDKRTAGMKEGKPKAFINVKTTDPNTGETITVRVPLKSNKSTQGTAGVAPVAPIAPTGPSGPTIPPAAPIVAGKPKIRIVTDPKTGKVSYQAIDDIAQSAPDVLPEVAPLLSGGLSGAKPRYNSGTSVYMPIFDNDIDKAAYILAQTNKSTKDADYLEFVMTYTGLDEAGARALGARVRAAIKTGIKDVTPGTQEIPSPVKIAKVWGQEAPINAPVSAAPIAAQAPVPDAPTALTVNTLSKKEQLEHLKEEIKNSLKTTGSPRDIDALTQNLAAIEDELAKISGAVSPAAPIADAGNFAGKQTETIADTLLKRGLKDLNYSDDAISKMSPEEMQSIVANKTMAPSGVVPGMRPTRGGGVDIGNVLTIPEKQEAIMAALTKDGFPKELLDVYGPHSLKYRELEEQIAALGKPVVGTPEFEKLKLLKQDKVIAISNMRVIIAQAEENGLIPKGTGATITDKIKQAMEDANHEKFFNQIPLGPSRLGDVPAGAQIRLDAIRDAINKVGSDPNMTLAERQLALDTYTKEYETVLGEFTSGTPKVAGTAASPVKTTAAASAKASVPFMITKQMEADLKKLGFDDAAINKMTPADAHAALQVAPPTNEGGTVIGSLLGGSQGIQRAIQNNPEFITQLLSGAAGAGAGAIMSPEPVTGALIGGMTGLVAPGAVKSFKKFSGLQVDPGVAKTPLDWGAAARNIPNLYRANLLADPTGLTINTVAAPWGAGVVGSTERILSGAIAATGKKAGLNIGGDVADIQRGLGGIKELVRPAHIRRFYESLKKAGYILHGVNERGEMIIGPQAVGIEKAIALPGTLMYGGDLATRTALIKAGVPEPLARAITLTANPKTGVGERVVDFAKGHPFAALLQPFSRTAVNIVESGLERAPGFGILFNSIRNPEYKQSIADVIAQQGLGVGMTALGYYAGLNIDPDWAKTNSTQKLISNMSGQYGALVQAGFAAGIASQYGKPAVLAALNSLGTELPLPSTSGPLDTAKSLSNILQGEPAHPTAQYWPEQWLPKMATPGFLKDRWMENWGTIADDLRGKKPGFQWNLEE